MKKLFKLSTAIIILTLLTGCISTPYQAGKGSFRGGFSEIQLGENQFKVSFKGNAYISKSTTSDYTLLRSAEICLEHNYKYFSIVGSDSSISTSTYTRPATLNTYQPMYGGATRIDFDAGRTTTWNKPSSTNTIVCYNDKKQGVNPYDASFIIKSIKSAHDIK